MPTSTNKRLNRIPYASLDELLVAELKNDDGEHGETPELINKLCVIRKTKKISRDEFLMMCHWKSPRAMHHYSKNSEATIRTAIRAVFSTRSERRRLALLTRLKGVSVPMASAILMLTNPKRYGVIDIRVWQLLYTMGSVTSKPAGKAFTFNNWYHYLSKLRYLAEKHGVSVRTVERTLFRYHKKVQLGTLY